MAFRTSQDVLLLFFFFSAAHSSALSLDTCLDSLDVKASVFNTTSTWGEVLKQPVYELNSTSYLRPDVGGALLPYFYTIIIILLHIPVVVIRVVRWEKVQAWCLAAVVFTLAVTIQGYVSTKFDPAQILTWTPLLSVIP